MTSLYYDVNVGVVASNPNGWTAADEGKTSLLNKLIAVLF